MTYDSPFVGPRPFERQDSGRFFGRRREREELLSLIIAHRVVLIYAQSGAGKTSLLSAGVIPQLEEHGYRVLPTARVQGLVPVGIAEAAVRNIFVFHALQYWLPLLEPGKTAADFAQTTLVEFLTPLVPVSTGSDEESPSCSIIIFDQFEEFFTVHPERWQERMPFFAQLTTALSALPTLKVAFVMREEYIAQLEAYAADLPEKLRARMHLERLRGNAALNAVVKPFQSWGLSFEQGAAEKLMGELAEIRVAEGQNFREARGEFVEPVQLQVVCQFLWENLPANWKNGSTAAPPAAAVITEEYVERWADVNDALARFYDRSVEQAAKEGKIGEGELRRWIETALITPTGTRGLAFRGAKGAAGRIPGLSLKQLEEAHVIRREERAGTITHELTHDRFIEPIQASNMAWLEHHAEEEKIRARLEEKTLSYETASELLDEACLREAEKFLATPGADLLGVSRAARELVRRSRKQIEDIKKEQAEELAEAHRHAEEQRRRRILERKFWVAVFALGTIAVLAVGYVVYDRWKEADIARKHRGTEAKEHRKKAAEDLAAAEKAPAENPIASVTALRHLALALRLNPKDTTVARLTATLLLQRVWCPPLGKEIRYGKDALLAATFSPEGNGDEVFAIAGNGELLHYKGGAESEPPQALFTKPEPAGGDKIVQPGLASFSPDGQWLLVLLPAVAPAGSAPPDGPGSEQNLRSIPRDEQGQRRELGAWRWSSQNRKFESTGAPLSIEWLSAARATFVWSNRSDKVVLTHSIQDATRSVFLELGGREVRERKEWSDRLNQPPQVSVLAFNSDDTRIASISADWRVMLLDAATLSIIPSAIAGEDEFQLPKGFQPNSVIFGPKEDELTLMSWRGARVLNLQTRKLVAVPATFRDQSIRRVVGRGNARDRLVATSLYGRALVARGDGSSRGAHRLPRRNGLPAVQSRRQSHPYSLWVDAERPRQHPCGRCQLGAVSNTDYN